MQRALTLESHDVALDLYSVLRDLDPVRWKDDVEQAVRQRVQGIHRQLAELADSTMVPDSLHQLRDHLNELADLIEARLPDPQLSDAELKDHWMLFRAELQPAYESLARSLRGYAIHVPSLRPTNYTRNVFHVAGGLIALLLVQHVLTPTTMMLVAGAVAGAGWTMEFARRYVPGANTVIMRIFASVAHPHEAHRINSSTWFSTALVVLALTSSMRTAALAVVVLAFADPAAALVGRRFGRTKLVNGRSLEGTLAFAAVGTLACLAVLGIYYPALSLAHTLAIAAAGSCTGAVAELFSRRIDDNLSIPVSVAVGVGLVSMLLGIG